LFWALNGRLLRKIVSEYFLICNYGRHFKCQCMSALNPTENDSLCEKAEWSDFFYDSAQLSTFT